VATPVPPTGGTGTTPTAGTGSPVAGTSSPTGGTGVATAGTSAGTGTPTGGTGVATGGTGGSSGSTNGIIMCPPPAGAAKDGACKATAAGIYAMKTEVDVWWRDENNTPTLYDPGRGKIVIYFKGDISDICQDGSGGKGLIQACGDTVPPIMVDATCGVIQIVFPDMMWDQPTIPKFMTTGSTSGFMVGDTLTVAKAAGLVGIDLTDVNAPWPTFDQTTTFKCTGGMTDKACFPDHDNDGHPGITVKLQQDGTPMNLPYTCLSAWKYVTAPISTFGATDPNGGAVDTYIGLRTRIGGSGKIGADCKSGTGPAMADGFESRLYGCKLKNGMDCKNADANFVDKNLPNYHVLAAGAVPPAEWKHPRADADAKLDRTPSKGPQSSVVRVADLGATVTCAQIRATQYPAFTN
jgi:hypothetical protein